MARPENTAERREQILDGLMRVIARKGYAAATTAAVAKAAKLAPGLIHYHFESKQELLLALLERLSALLEARRRERLSAGDDDGPWAQVDAFIDACLALDAKADPLAVACWTALSAEAIGNPEVGAQYRKVVHRHAQLLQEAVLGVLALTPGEDEARRHRAREASATLLGAIYGCFQLAAAAPGTLPTGAAAANVRAMARGLLGPGATPPSRSA